MVMKGLHRVHAALGIDTRIVPQVIMRAHAIHDGLAADTMIYSAPSPPLLVFAGLIQALATAQQAVSLRTKGAAATRDVHRGLLHTAMESERMYVQSLCDSAPSRAIALIENAGLVVAATPVPTKAFLTLKPGKQPGSVIAEANVGLLKSALTLRATQYVFYNWQLTLDRAQSFVNLPPTTTGRTVVSNLTPLTTVGVRVNLNTLDGPGEWSQVVYTLVHG
jgi:hypothetical protein